MWQQVIVIVIVAAAVLHFCTRFLPLPLRRRIVFWLSQRGCNQARMAALFKTTPGCGDGCSSCGSCDSPAPPASGDGGAPKQRVIMLQVQR